MKDVIEQLQEIVAQEREDTLAQNSERFSGPEYAYLLEAEEIVFDLSPDDIKIILPVFDMYEAIADRAYNEFHNTPLCSEARKVFSWISQNTIDEQEWRRFAKMFGISNRKAHCFYWKVSFWELRKGLVTFADEK